MYFSKSQYLRGLQCHKALWLYRYRRELMAPADSNRIALFDTGHEVGELARACFPGGIEVESRGGDTDAMIARTAELIARGVEVIYEAAFGDGELLAIADILVRNGACWDFYEVKSSTRVKPLHLEDAAFQWRVLDRHVALGKAYIMHIDSGYRRDGELDPQQLLHSVDVTAGVTALQSGLAAKLASMQELLAGNEPDVAIGLHCNNPFECDFKARCWHEVPVPSVLDLYRLPGARRFELYHQGRVRYRDLRSLPLSRAQALQVDSALSGKLHVERQRLRDFIRSASYPLQFLDFETLQHAVPRFDGQRPYQQIPFQYSLHILRQDGEIEHREYLADEHGDPRPALATRLARDLEPNGSIVAYSQATEIRAINTLATCCPEQAERLRAATRRCIDLLRPFRELMYYHPDFNGDFSIKSVLPAMFPDQAQLNYSDLEIRDGRSAMTLYAGLEGQTDASERRRIRDALRAYCRLDTLAMVRIWQALASASRATDS